MSETQFYIILSLLIGIAAIAVVCLVLAIGREIESGEARLRESRRRIAELRAMQSRYQPPVWRYKETKTTTTTTKEKP